MRPHIPPYLLAALGAGLFGCAMALCWIGEEPRAAADSPADISTVTGRPLSGSSGSSNGPYVGNAVCAECHSKEFAQHKSTRHDITLRPANVRLLAALTPPTGPISETAYAVTRQGESFTFGQQNAKGTTVELAFGSGKTGMTYAKVGPDNRLTEFRMSRIPSANSWYITPGQESRADLEPGLVHSVDMTRRCLRCHAVSLPTATARPEPNMMGVGCESCHGPAGPHVAAARIKGNLDLKIERMSRWTARKVNELCAKCHRSQDDVSLMTRDASSTQRFQPYGLMMSPCFKKSGEKLSCSTCHDAHTNVSTDRRGYERVCLTCHAAPGTNLPPDPRVAKDAAHGKRPCPVNPREKCVSCHMPATQIFPGSKLPVKMADHMIWSYSRKRPG